MHEKWAGEKSATARPQFQAAPKFAHTRSSQPTCRGRTSDGWTTFSEDNLASESNLCNTLHAPSTPFSEPPPVQATKVGPAFFHASVTALTKRRRVSISPELDHEILPNSEQSQPSPATVEPDATLNLETTGYQHLYRDDEASSIEVPERPMSPRSRSCPVFLGPPRFRIPNQQPMPHHSIPDEGSPYGQFKGYLPAGLASEIQTWLSVARAGEGPLYQTLSSTFPEITFNQVFRGETVAILEGRETALLRVSIPSRYVLTGHGLSIEETNELGSLNVALPYLHIDIEKQGPVNCLQTGF